MLAEMTSYFFLIFHGKILENCPIVHAKLSRISINYLVKFQLRQSVTKNEFHLQIAMKIRICQDQGKKHEICKMFRVKSTH